MMMPELCNIKELKANTDAVWSPNGQKFAVGAASGNVFVGWYNRDVGLWIANPLSDKAAHDSPVTNVRFDPISGKCLVSCSTDGKVICFSHVCEVDNINDGPFGGLQKDDKLFQFKCTEWVNTVAFSPSGSEIAFASK